MATYNQMQVQQKPKFSVAITTKGYQSLISNTLRDPARARRFTASITSAVAVNPALQECDAGTILAGALLGESLNLSPSPQLGQYYLVPFKQKAKYDRNNRLIRQESVTAQFVLGYKGYIQLALRSGQYKDLDAEQNKFAELLAEVIMGMEQNPDQDFLGELYMLCELGNDASGQFFTPYDVCRCMVEISGGSDPAAENAGFFSVSDPACGAGALLIAFANLCRRKNICYHDKVLFVAQDIDLIAGLMCYIQLSFLGCAGYVVIGNTITEPSTAYDRRGLLPAGPQSRIWYTPFFSTDIWFLRRQWAQIELLMKPVCRQTEQAEPEHKKDDAAPPLCETKTGQLTFF